jgi:lysophospholipase L1-like esterase
MRLTALCCVLTAVMSAPLLAQGRTNNSSSQTAETPFASEIAAFEASDKTLMPPLGGVLFIGSSSIRLWKTLAEDFAEIPVINRGFGGSQIADSVRYVERIVFPYQPKMIVMYAGGNDLNSGKSPAQVLKDFQEFQRKIHAELPATRLVYISINPSVARWSQEANVLETNRLIRQFIKDKATKTRKLTFLDSHSRLLSRDNMPRPEILQPDGLHLNAKGYAEWKAILKPPILKLWKQETKSASATKKRD